MERLQIFSVEEMEPYIINDGKAIFVHKDEIARSNSLRMVTFKEKGSNCVVCGCQGAFYSMERLISQYKKTGAPKVAGYHINLYGVMPDGTVRLMTHDHIYPRCHGGLNTLENSTTMCEKCNCSKASKMPTPEFVAIHGGATGPYKEANVGKSQSPYTLEQQAARKAAAKLVRFNSSMEWFRKNQQWSPYPRIV